MNDRAFSDADVRAGIERECRADDLATDAERLTWALYTARMRAPQDSPRQRRLDRTYRRAMRRLFRRSGGEDAYWQAVAL
jgi:hypothetical protein